MARGLTLLVLALAAAACGDAVPRICARPASKDPVDFSGGTTKDGVYTTSDWDGEYLRFAGGAYYRLHHNLGTKSPLVNCVLSFERYGTEGRTSTAAAGNQVQYAEFDTNTMTVTNATCVDFWLRCELRR